MEKSKMQKVIPGDEWIKHVLKKLDIDWTLVSHVAIEAYPNEPLKVHITHLGTEDLFDVPVLEPDEVEVQRLKFGKDSPKYNININLPESELNG